MTVLPLLAALSVVQGQAALLSLPDQPGLVGAEVTWNGRRIPFARDGERWMTVIGVDLDMKPDAYSADVALRYANGEMRTETRVVEVGRKRFPTTELNVAPKFVELSPEDQERAGRESQEIGAIYARLTPEALWSEPFQAPLVGVSGGRNFGHRRIFNGQPRAPHSGADLTAGVGTEVRAANRGRVVLAKNLFFGGNAVFLDHGLGVYSVYLHLSKTLVEPGALVERGEVLGLAGATGRVTGPHLHWGVRILDARVDPFSLLEFPVGEMTH